MAAGGIGAFLSGLVDGVNTRRQWKREEEEAAFNIEDRKLRLEDRQLAKDDRLYNRGVNEKKLKWMEEDRLIDADERAFDRRLKIEDRAETRKERGIRIAAASLALAREQQDAAETGAIKAASRKAFQEAQANYDAALNAPEDPAEAAPDRKGDGSMLRSNVVAKAAPAAAGITAPGPEIDPRAKRAAAADDFLGYYAETAGPKIRDAFLAQGNVEAAQTWQAWTQEAGVKKGMRDYGLALHAAQMGDEIGRASCRERVSSPV